MSAYACLTTDTRQDRYTQPRTERDGGCLVLRDFEIESPSIQTLRVHGAGLSPGPKRLSLSLSLSMSCSTERERSEESRGVGNHTPSDLPLLFHKNRCSSSWRKEMRSVLSFRALRYSAECVKQHFPDADPKPKGVSNKP